MMTETSACLTTTWMSRESGTPGTPGQCGSTEDQ